MTPTIHGKNCRRAVRSNNIWIVIGGAWKGDLAGLKKLNRLPGVVRISFYGFPLADDDLQLIAGLPNLTKIELYGTKITDNGKQHLEQMYPGAEIERRGNAQLGVRGSAVGNACTIESVQAGSAAEQGGLRAGDIVLKFQGTPVGSFEALTTEIAKCRAGDKVEIEIQRPREPPQPDETLKKQITLGEWK